MGDMMRAHKCVCLILLLNLIVFCGCRSRPNSGVDDTFVRYQAHATDIEYPDVDLPYGQGLVDTPPPFCDRDKLPAEIWSLTLADAIEITLANSEVIRDIGGRVVSSPGSVRTVYDPAIFETDPRLGPEAALAAFDAQFFASMDWAKNDRIFNNRFYGGGANSKRQDLADFQLEINKTAATGTLFSVRNLTDYDADNSPQHLFGSAHQTRFEAEFRHPLLQGSGIEFNRIAGPNAQPGSYNGVVLSRINTDLALADFETAVRDLLFSVESTYWQLYFAYRDLDARRAGRDAALEIWRNVQRKRDGGMADLEQEARARQQYFTFDKQVLNALVGTVDGSRICSPSGGVYATERKLRTLMGLPPADKLIRPVDVPSIVETHFDWRETIEEALYRRSELRKQKWNIKRRELELIAARNFTRVRLDAMGLYRWRGLGDELLGDAHLPMGSAFGELFGGKYQEWQLGLEMSMPIGNRVGHLAVRNAHLMLARERALYQQQELQVLDEASSAFAELKRSQAAVRIDFNRAQAAYQQLHEIRKKWGGGLTELEFLLDANIRTTEAESAYYRSEVNADLAVSRVFLARGALLDYYDVYLAEGPWSQKAHRSAAKQARKYAPRVLNYALTIPPPVSAGIHYQQTEQETQTWTAPDENSDALPEQLEALPGFLDMVTPAFRPPAPAE